MSWGRWAGPGQLVGLSAGFWIVGAEVGLLLGCFTSSVRGSSLKKEQERRRAGRGFARGRSDA